MLLSQKLGKLMTVCLIAGATAFSAAARADVRSDLAAEYDLSALSAKLQENTRAESVTLVDVTKSKGWTGAAWAADAVVGLMGADSFILGWYKFTYSVVKDGQEFRAELWFAKMKSAISYLPFSPVRYSLDIADDFPGKFINVSTGEKVSSGDLQKFFGSEYLRTIFDGMYVNKTKH